MVWAYWTNYRRVFDATNISIIVTRRVYIVIKFQVQKFFVHVWNIYVRDYEALTQTYLYILMYEYILHSNNILDLKQTMFDVVSLIDVVYQVLYLQVF